MAEGKSARGDEGRESGGSWREWRVWNVFGGKDDGSSRGERAADTESSPTEGTSEVPESGEGEAIGFDEWAAMSAEEQLAASNLAQVGGASSFKELTGKDWSELTLQERGQALAEAADLQAVGGREGFRDLTGKDWDSLTEGQRNEAIKEEGEVALLGGREGFRDLTGQDWDALSPGARTEAAQQALAEMAEEMRQMDLGEDGADQGSSDASDEVPSVATGPVVPADGSAADGAAASPSEDSSEKVGGGIPASADEEPAENPSLGAAVAVITGVDGSDDARTVYMDEHGNFFLDDGTPHSGYLDDGRHLSEVIDTSGTFHEFEGDVIDAGGSGSAAGGSESGAGSGSPDGSGSSSEGSTDSSDDSADDSSSGDGDGDDDDDDGESDTTDAAAGADAESAESEDDEGTGGSEGTPHPDHDDVDPAELAAFMDSPLGREARRTEERGIEVKVSGGLTDPVEPSGDSGVPVASNVRPGRGDVDPPGEFEESSGFGPIDEMQLPGAGLVDPIVLDVSGGPEDPSVGPPDDDDDSGGGGDDEGAIAARIGDVAFGSGVTRDPAASGSTSSLERANDVDDMDDATAGIHLGGLSAEQLAELQVDDGMDLSAAQAISSRSVDLSDLANHSAESIDTDQISNEIADG